MASDRTLRRAEHERDAVAVRGVVDGGRHVRADSRERAGRGEDHAHDGAGVLPPELVAHDGGKR